ncbi:MAG: Gfo/Idh/MocA family oxidoreductase [Planctomycetaceae bacterium]|nr:Gfo/Idh/MocA family oxidoreductase [Planctomycetaceae bacterium]
MKAVNRSSRRHFLKAGALFSSLDLPFLIPGSVLGLEPDSVPPSNRLTMGGIGVGNRGRGVLASFLTFPEVQFVMNADVQRTRREMVKEMVDKKYGNQDCRITPEMYDVLDREDIDFVLIATGDRWHTMLSILAAKAGKDIYCEKPCSLTIEESIALSETVNRCGRIYQAGTQRRSSPAFQTAIRFARSGAIGKITEVHANTLSPGTRHEWLPEEPLPDRNECDWDRWLGACPWRPFNSRYVAGGWRGHYDFHGGGILEWGSHTVDLCQMANQSDDTVPIRYEPTPGGCVAWYASGVKLVMRSEGWMGLGSCSIRVVGSDGWVEVGDTNKILTHQGPLPVSNQGLERGTQREHDADLLNAIRTRSSTRANADVAARSHIASHAAYIAWQLGRTLEFDPVKNEFLNDEEANRMRSRAKREPWHI